VLIAQVTDMHIRPEGQLVYRQVDTAAHLARCVDHLNGLDPAPDLVLFTGDLVDSPKPAAYAHLRRLLAGLRLPFYVIPGNHDGRQALREAFDDHDYLRQDPRFLHYAIEQLPLRLIGLDSTIPGENEGDLCAERLAWLQRTLTAAPQRPTLLFLHHPPIVTGIAYMDAYRCQNAEGLAAIIERHPQVVGLLCGHVHRSIQTAWCGRPLAIAPSPAHAFALELAGRGDLTAALEPPACLLHRWHDPGGLVTHLSHVGAFAEVYRHAPLAAGQP